MTDPWRDIAPPEHASSIVARRVEQSGAFDLYWGVDVSRNVLLMLEHARKVRKTRRLPNLRGLRVEAQTADDASRQRFVIRLTDPEQRELFLRFCLDIIDATVLSGTEEQAVDRFVSRTWRWHRLLRSGREDRLSDDEQRGLIGELGVLEKHLLPTLGVLDAVRSWTGPLSAPKDFEIGRVQVEAKARGVMTPKVTISSAHQLDSADGVLLFLHVTEVAIAGEDVVGAFTVSEYARKIRAVIAEHETTAVEHFEERLSALGFDWDDDYSDKLWVVRGESLYEVREGFPRITAAMVPGGIDNVRYALSLSECEAYRVELAMLTKAVGGAIV